MTLEDYFIITYFIQDKTNVTSILNQAPEFPNTPHRIQKSTEKEFPESPAAERESAPQGSEKSIPGSWKSSMGTCELQCCRASRGMWVASGKPNPGLLETGNKVQGCGLLLLLSGLLIGS